MIEWFESEWSEGGFTAEMGGVVADVFSDDFPLPGKPWAWTVRATASVSEYPEAWATGSNRTESAAKRAAEASLKRAAKHYRGSKGAQG